MLTEDFGQMCRDECEAVLSSFAFRRASTLSKILRYICERAIEDDSRDIKEISIAIEALGRPPDFDPAHDSIVRVEMSRLRKRLRAYYEADGAHNDIHISLPKAGYKPTFVRNGKAVSLAAGENQAVEGPDARQEPPEKSAAKSPRRAHWMVAGAVIVLILGGSLLIPRGARWASSLQVQAIDSNGRLSAIQPGDPPLELAENGVGLIAAEGIRINCGASGGPWADGTGQTWSPDRFVTGGEQIHRPEASIWGTPNPDLYRTARAGRFRYDIPVDDGLYEVHLHFAEILLELDGVYSDGTATRRFTIWVGGQERLDRFDIVADAGGINLPTEKVFLNVTPNSEGMISIALGGTWQAALLSGIEILPGIPDKMRPVRIVAADRDYVDSRGDRWRSDRYFTGGGITAHPHPVEGTPDPGLFEGLRFGSFSYRIPVSPGRYAIKLYFAETFFGPSMKGGVGSRVLDVFCNGEALLRNFDIVREAGGAQRAVVKEFRGLEPNAQDKLVLSFVSKKDLAEVRAIEVLAE